jgi:hypothetical protein
MPSFTFRMPAGIPGMVNRTEHAHVEAQIKMSTNPPTSYGVPVAIDATSKQIRPIGAGDTAANVYGFVVRPYPTQGTLGINQPLGTSTPPTSGATNVLRRGYVVVQLNGATAAVKNGPVYVRVAAATGPKPLGGVEAAADSTNTFALTGAAFMGPADAAGNVEISFNI